MSLHNELETKYEREAMLHGETTRQLVLLRETARSFDETVVELRAEKRHAEENLQELQARFSELESSSNSETELLRSHLEVLEKENAAVHEQLANISHQMTTLNKSGTELDVSLVGNESPDQVRLVLL